MSYNIIPTGKFKKEAKRLLRKYPSLKAELFNLGITLSTNPFTGTSLGNNTFKIRLAIKSKGTGKSGGARVITFIVNNDKDVYLLTIYDKAEFEVIADKTIRNIIDSIKGKK